MKSATVAVAAFVLCISMIAGGTAIADDNWVFTTFAGISGGGADGVGAHARFYIPVGAAFGPDGSAYIADSGNHTIRKITTTGVVSTVAGSAGVSGAVDGAASAARFYFPQGVAVDADGNVYVSDSGNYTIRKITAAGVVTTLAGLAGAPGSIDGAGAKARFGLPAGLAVDPDGNLYVADELNQTIRKVTPAGVVSTLAGRAGERGSSNGTGNMARFAPPIGIVFAHDGNLYVADPSNPMIRRVTTARGRQKVAGQITRHMSHTGG